MAPSTNRYNNPEKFFTELLGNPLDLAEFQKDPELFLSSCSIFEPSVQTQLCSFAHDLNVKSNSSPAAFVGVVSSIEALCCGGGGAMSNYTATPIHVACCGGGGAMSNYSDS